MTSQAAKQALISEIIAGVVIKEGAGIVAKAVRKGLNKVIDNPEPTTVANAAPVVVSEVEKVVVKEAQAQAEHKFDAEPHWQSRNLWGSLVALIGAADIMYRMWTDNVVDGPQAYIAQVAVIAGILTPLYSRFIAKKPLFR